jgi:hypothetical protein
LYVYWSKPKPKCIQKLIVIEGDPLIRNICIVFKSPTNFYVFNCYIQCFISAFVEQCLCPKMEEACIIENEKRKKVSVIYQIDKQIYICIILPQFDTKNAGKFINEACT